MGFGGGIGLPGQGRCKLLVILNVYKSGAFCACDKASICAVFSGANYCCHLITKELNTILCIPFLPCAQGLA